MVGTQVHVGDVPCSPANLHCGGCTQVQHAGYWSRPVLALWGKAESCL